MKILFLHISDLHIRSTEDIRIDCVREIGAALSPTSIGSPDCVLLLLTGDIAFSGVREQYLAFEQFINCLTQSMSAHMPQMHEQIAIFIVPGNHDIDYAGIADRDHSYYEDLLKDPHAVNLIDCDETSARSAYYEFSHNYESIDHDLPMMCRHVHDLGASRLKLICSTVRFSL